MGTAGAATGLGGEGGGGDIHGPEQQADGGEVVAASVNDAHDLDAVESDVVPVHRDAKPGEGGEAAGTSRVVEARLGVEVMATAGAAADGGLKAAASVGEDVAAKRNDWGTRVHRASAGAKVQGRFGGEGRRGEKSEARLRR